MAYQSNLIIHKDVFSFSAGHFTIFSATEREQLHGHNYNVSIAFELMVNEYGLSFDYREYKTKIKNICNEINGRFLLPQKSPYLILSEDEEHVYAIFNNKKLSFLREDVVTLPLSNITIEELSHWFLENFLQFKHQFINHHIHSVTINVYNGPGQSAGATWKANAEK